MGISLMRVLSWAPHNIRLPVQHVAVLQKVLLGIAGRSTGDRGAISFMQCLHFSRRMAIANVKANVLAEPIKSWLLLKPSTPKSIQPNARPNVQSMV